MWNLRGKKIAAIITILIMPIVSFFMFETVAGNFKTIINGNILFVLMNLCIWYILYAVIFALVNRVRITILIMNCFTYFLALANAFVIRFRLQPIMPMDLRTIRTAASVAKDYEYDFSAEMLTMGVLFILISLWAIGCDYKIDKWKARLTYVAITVGCTWYVLFGMLAGNWFEKAGSTGLDFFRFDLTYAREGYMVCTIKSIRFLRVEKPEGYSVEKVEEIAGNITEKGEGNKDLPENVIVIMNESFSDLSVLGEFQTSEPVLPYYYGLTGENVKRGNLYVSIFGGATANTEFEFLSGNSAAYIPQSSVAYQMYVDEGDSSIVSCFKENGYKTIAYHPFKKENYNRDQVYSIYGFDEYYGLDDMSVKKSRKYATDKSVYKNLIKMYEKKEPGEKLFIFNVTMQNHSGYDNQKFNSTIRLTEYPEKFPQTEQYLSLIKKSDEALEYLLDYFSKVDEKTVILFFGDHQPRLEDGFVEFLLEAGSSGSEFLDLQKKHVTKYLLWSNYPLDTKEEENISANFLGSYLLKSIGMEMPAYNKYLLDVQKQVPAMNVYGFLDRKGNMHWNGDKAEFSEMLDEYEVFQYNNLFDNSHRLHDLYE